VVTAWQMIMHKRLKHAGAEAGAGLGEVSACPLIESDPGMTVDQLRSRVGLPQPGTVRLIDLHTGTGAYSLMDRNGSGGAGGPEPSGTTDPISARNGQRRRDGVMGIADLPLGFCRGIVPAVA